jgi:hypothetical protein
MSNTTLLSVWAGGIQDISVVATVLGTELCENHLDNILEGGYLYGSIVSISMFGILSVTKWGIKNVLGKENCEKMKLEASGDVMQFIWDYESESNPLEKLLSQKYYTQEKINLNMGWINAWFFMMIFTNTIFSIVSIIPILIPLYVSDVELTMIVFPIGTALSTIIVIPLCVMLQIDEIALFTTNVANMINDLEVKVENEFIFRYKNRSYINIFIIIFSILNIICYVGNYAIVQMSDGNSPLYWLISEAVLMAFRMFVWYLDPKHDNPPPIQVDNKIEMGHFNIDKDGNIYNIKDFYDNLCKIYRVIQIGDETTKIDAKNSSICIKDKSLYFFNKNKDSALKLWYEKNIVMMKYLYMEKNITLSTSHLSDYNQLESFDVYDQLDYKKYKDLLANLLKLSIDTPKGEYCVFYGHINWNGDTFNKDKTATVLLGYGNPKGNNGDFIINKRPFIMKFVEEKIRCNNNDMKTVYNKYWN